MGVITDEMTLVGRKSEQEHFSRLLDGAQPALVLVKGEHGSGKTSLLRVLQDQLAQRLDWESAPAEDNWPLAITPDLYDMEFAQRISLELGISTSGAFAVAKKATKELNPLVESLAQLAPLALFIDGFQPNRIFERWFCDVFLRDVQRSGAAIVVVLADEPKSFIHLDSSPIPTEEFNLGRLKPKEIRERFEAICAQAGITLTDEELNHYIQVVREKPEYYKSLARLLQFGGKMNPPAVEPA